tara:strand:- start:81 stop:275 length:195 start_codon:yes stop_codon:yes gene_type:complete
MNLAEKVIGVALVGLMALISWNLVTTINLQKEILTIKHEQNHLHQTIEKQFEVIRSKLKKKKNN